MYDSLASSSEDANAGKIYGNRMFYDNDYMVRLLLCLPKSSPNQEGWHVGPARRWICQHPSHVLIQDTEHRVRELAERERPAPVLQHGVNDICDSPLASISQTGRCIHIFKATSTRISQLHGIGTVSVTSIDSPIYGSLSPLQSSLERRRTTLRRT